MLGIKNIIEIIGNLYKLSEQTILQCESLLSSISEKQAKIIFQIENMTKKNLTYLKKKQVKKIKRKTIFSCKHKGCEKKYVSNENLKLHNSNIHLRKKPYKCKFCKSKFSHLNGKTYHERKEHLNYLPFSCESNNFIF